MASNKQKPSEPGTSRRELLGAGSRLFLFGAMCATVGTTIIAACMSGDNDPGNTNGPGKYDYGFGYGYHCGDGYGYGYGYGYGCGYGQ